MSKKTILFFSIIFISLSICFTPILAQETTVSDAEPEITAEELGVSEPGVIGWFTNVVRNVRILVTRDPIRKSELQLESANYEMLRAREAAQKDLDEIALKERLERIDQKYKETISAINQRIEQVKQEDPSNPQLKNFLDNYTSQQLKHQQILQRIEERVPEQVMEAIRERRQEHLEEFGQVMNRIQEKEEFKERLKNNLEDTQIRVEHRARIAEIVEELGEKVQEVKQEINEVKLETREVFQDLKEKREEIRENQQEMINQLKANSGDSSNIQERAREQIHQETNDTNQTEASSLKENLVKPIEAIKDRLFNSNK